MDLGLRRAVRGLGGAGDPAGVAALAQRWKPWRAYAAQHLWASLGEVSEVHEPTKRELVA